MKKYIKVIILFLFIVSMPSWGYEVNYSPIDNGNYQSNYSYNDINSSGYHKYSHTSFRNKGNRSLESGKRYLGLGKTVVFDPKSLRWYAFYDGNLVNTGRASGGRLFCSDIRRPCRTPVGVFRVGHKGGPDCKSSKYPIGRGNAPMPWCMFFHGGYAIHGSWSVPGYNASHGCIRVPPSDARWLNTRFVSSGTKVVVRGYH